MNATTLTLTDFLLARIAEDETAARRVLDNKPYFQQIAWGWFDADFGDFHQSEYGAEGVGLPTRVLAECAAKRAIVDAAWGNRGQRILKHLASVYADHPDYNPDWAWRTTKDRPPIRR